MKLKAILCDFDGTLVNNKLEYNHGVKLLIERIKNKNIRFSMATGQPNYSIIRKVLIELGVEDYHIFHGGGLILHNTTNEILWNQYIPEESLFKILNYFKEKKLFYALETNEASYFSHDAGEQNYLPFSKVKLISQLSNFKNVLKILLTPLDNKLMEKQADFHKENLSKICKDLAFSKFFYIYHGMDITSEKATKHTAVLEYEKLLNIPRSQIIGIGDSHNDYPLFTACGYKIAMGNAPEDLKKMADFIAPPIEKNGTIVALEHIISKFYI